MLNMQVGHVRPHSPDPLYPDPASLHALYPSIHPFTLASPINQPMLSLTSLACRLLFAPLTKCQDTFYPTYVSGRVTADACLFCRLS